MKRTLYCGVKINFKENPWEPREIRECGDCKNSCIGKFVDDDLKDCINFIPKRISAEERYLQRVFSSKKKQSINKGVKEL